MDIKFLSILGADYGSGLPGVQMQPILIEEPQPAAYNPSQHSTSEGRSEEAVWLNVDLEGNSDDLTTAVSRPSDTGTNTDSGTTQIIEVPSTSSAHIMVTERIESPRPSTSSIDMQSNVPSGITQFVEGREVPRRRRRLRRRHVSIAEAREQLVATSRSRAEAELANSRSIEQAVGILKEMLDVMKRICPRSVIRIEWYIFFSNKLIMYFE
ncbi:uncharacterized protein LOC128200975 [Galleria mellonella]|uniref:Uncharacterized protein LOC128200975 n=1 Tax=Galleria mellonella TaxID=7137 RepID=A0ABM3MLT9_GALME|nr:uncharacterized protein LOC128200975 [Galleria mellonella]